MQLILSVDLDFNTIIGIINYQISASHVIAFDTKILAILYFYSEERF